MNGPAVIAAVVRWMHRDSHIIPWEYVARIDDRGVGLSGTPPRIPLDPGRSIAED